MKYAGEPRGALHDTFVAKTPAPLLCAGGACTCTQWWGAADIGTIYERSTSTRRHPRAVMCDEHLEVFPRTGSGRAPSQHKKHCKGSPSTHRISARSPDDDMCKLLSPP